jgi:hypothetical protein
VELETALIILSGTFGSAKIVEKLLGPTAEYLGGGIRDYTKKGMTNLGRIFEHAAKILGDKLDEPGQVPPRVLKGILQEGYFCEDELTAKYFGGVLASSRSGVGRDDRAASFISLTSRLSTYQVRSHFIFYSVFKDVCNGRSDNLGLSSERDKFKLYVPIDSYSAAMDFQQGESVPVLIPHIMNGLHRESLIGGTWTTGSERSIKESARIDVPKGGIVFYPSAPGMELYLWAHGRSDAPVGIFLKTAFSPVELTGLVLPSDAKCYGL